VETAALDQGHDRESGQALGAAGDPELGLEGVGDRMRPIRHAEGGAHHGLSGVIDSHHPGEARLQGHLVDHCPE